MKITHLTSLLLGLITLAPASLAYSNEPSFSSANEAYQDGRYGEAIGAFETLGHQSGWSEPILYNLGNAYAQAGSPGAALLAYDRAVLLKPRDADLRHNRDVVLASTGQTHESPLGVGRIVGLYSATEWSGMLLVASWLLCGTVAMLILQRRFRRLLAAAVAVLGLGTVGGALAVAVIDASLGDVVVTGNRGASLLLSPFEGATVQTSIPAGSRLRAGAEHAGFVHVDDGHGHTGWIDSSAAEPLLPRSTPT